MNKFATFAGWVGLIGYFIVAPIFLSFFVGIEFVLILVSLGLGAGLAVRLVRLLIGMSLRR